MSKQSNDAGMEGTIGTLVSVSAALISIAQYVASKSKDKDVKVQAENTAGLLDQFTEFLEKPGGSNLIQYSKKLQVNSNAFVEKSLYGDDVLPNLISLLNVIYASYVLAALNLANNCEDAYIRKVLRTVSTESFKNDVIDVVNEFNSYPETNVKVSMEAGPVLDLESQTQRLGSAIIIEIDFGTTRIGVNQSSMISARGSVQKQESRGKGSNVDVTGTNNTPGKKTTTTTDSDILVPNTQTGRMDRDGTKRTQIEEQENSESIAKKKGRSKTSTDSITRGSDISAQVNDAVNSERTVQLRIPILVQMLPYLIDSDALLAYMDLTVKQSITTRWNQAMSGEIRFFKDFLLGMDMVAKHGKVLKKDRSGHLNAMLSRKLSSWAKFMSGATKHGYHNIANSVMIIEKKSLDIACRRKHINWENYLDRQNFMDEAFLMMIAVVDPMYSTVDLYFNSIERGGNYTYAMINKSNSKKETFNLKDLMAIFGQGNIPKF